MKVYVLMRFERYQMNKHYGDYGCYYQEEFEIIDVYLNKETAEKEAEERNKKYRNENYEEEQEYYVDCWRVNEE